MPDIQMKPFRLKIMRDGEVKFVPFCELKENDLFCYTKDENGESNHIFRNKVGEDGAHRSGDASYAGWLFYDVFGDPWFPEDFGAKLTGNGEVA